MLAALILSIAASGVFAEVSPDPDGSAGVIRARVDIEAPPAVVWAVIQDCTLARKMSANVQSCKVMDRARDGSWDIRELVVQAPLVPKVRSVFRSEYEPVRRITFRCTGGDVKMCEGEWRLVPLQNGGTRVHYVNRATSPFSLPAAVTREVMKGDIVKSLKALRRESVAATR